MKYRRRPTRFLRIKLMEGTKPIVDVKMPLGFVKAAGRLIPKPAVRALKEKGLDLNRLLKQSDVSRPRTLFHVKERRRSLELFIE